MFKKFLSITVILCFILTTLGPLPQAHADTVLNLPQPGTMINLSPNFEPALIRGLTVHKDNPFLFDFIVDPGQSKISQDDLKEESNRMIKYFFASLTIPDKDIWVNLSPYEKDRMIPQSLGTTAMGRDLLAQDYMLKQLTASLIYPQQALGQTFWTKVYAKAKEMYGTTQIPVNTFNKVWIVPQSVGIYEHGQTAFIVNGHLKVMLEEDYLSMTKHNAISNTLSASETKQSQVNRLGSQVIRAIILPEIEKEVNEDKNFSTLRQIFYAQALAVWFKRNLKQALLNQVYANKSTVKGIDQNDTATNEAIYHQYLKAYKKGVFNFIKNDVDPVTQENLPRKYFSGGYDTENIAFFPALPNREMTIAKYADLLVLAVDHAMLGGFFRELLSLPIDGDIPQYPPTENRSIFELFNNLNDFPADIKDTAYRHAQFSYLKAVINLMREQPQIASDIQGFHGFLETEGLHKQDRDKYKKQILAVLRAIEESSNKPQYVENRALIYQLTRAIHILIMLQGHEPEDLSAADSIDNLLKEFVRLMFHNVDNLSGIQRLKMIEQYNSQSLPLFVKVGLEFAYQAKKSEDFFAKYWAIKFKDSSLGKISIKKENVYPQPEINLDIKEPAALRKALKKYLPWDASSVKFVQRQLVMVRDEQQDIRFLNYSVRLKHPDSITNVLDIKSLEEEVTSFSVARMVSGHEDAKDAAMTGDREAYALLNGVLNMIPKDVQGHFSIESKSPLSNTPMRIIFTEKDSGKRTVVIWAKTSEHECTFEVKSSPKDDEKLGYQYSLIHLRDINHNLNNAIKEVFKGISKWIKHANSTNQATIPKGVDGGIDLSQQDAAMHIVKDANGGVKVDVDPALIARVEREGMSEVDPVIIGMRSADIQSLFGVGVFVATP